MRSQETGKETEEDFFEVVGEIVGEIFGHGNIGKSMGEAVDKFFKGLFGGCWKQPFSQ